MSLNNFSSYFELLAGINLGYAVFEYFRNQLKTGIFNIDQKISKELVFLKDRLKVQISEKSNNAAFSKMLQEVEEEITVTLEILESKEQEEQIFIGILEPVSYISAFFCITIMIVSGFITTYEGKEHIDTIQNLSYCVYIFGVQCAIFSFAIFSGTFSERVLYKKQILSIGQVIFSLILFILFAYFFVFYISCSLDYKWNVCLVLILPTLVYMILSYVNIRKNDNYAQKNFKRIVIDSLNLCKENFMYGGLFILVLIVFFVPVGLHMKNSQSCGYSFYLVVLTVPMLLYFFMPIRVFWHKYKFRKKYSKLCIQQTQNLDFVLSKIN